jgi:hypothetical protein
MFSRYKIMRMAAAVAAALFLLPALTSCFGIQVKYAPSAEPSAASGTAPVSPSEDPAVAAFMSAFGKVLTEAPSMSRALASAPLDVLFRPVLKETAVGSDYTYAKMHLTEPGTPPENEITLSGESILNAETGSASFAAVRQTGSAAEERAGVWFEDNTMLVKMSGETQPLVAYTFSPQAAQSLAALPAFERFGRVLGDMNAAAISREDWSAAVTAYLDTAAENSRVQDISSEAGTETFAGLQTPTTSGTLKLIGPRGLNVARGLLSLIGKDSAFKSLFNTQSIAEDGQYGVTGIDGVLRDIDALNDSDRSMAVTTVELVTADGLTARPVGIRMTVDAGGKTAGLDITYFEKDSVRQDALVFRGFDASRVSLGLKIAAGADGTFTAEFGYNTLGPGGQPQEELSVTSAGTASDGALSVTSQISFTRAASPVSGATAVSGTLSYAQTTADAVTQGSGYGSLDISDSGETHTYDFDMTSMQKKEAVPVTPPSHDAGSVLSTAAQDSLFKALGGFDGSSFALAQPTTRIQAVFMLLFS